MVFPALSKGNLTITGLCRWPAKSWILYQRSMNPKPVRSLDEARALSSIGVVRGDIREEWLLAQGFTNLQASASHAQKPGPAAQWPTGRYCL